MQESTFESIVLLVSLSSAALYHIYKSACTKEPERKPLFIIRPGSGSSKGMDLFFRNHGWDVEYQKAWGAFSKADLAWIYFPCASTISSSKNLVTSRSNFIPSLRNSCFKGLVTQTYNIMKEKFPEIFNFMNEGFALPFDLDKFEKVFQKDDIWIMKDSSSSKGAGCKLVTNLELVRTRLAKLNVREKLEIETVKIAPIIIERYVTNPILTSGHKSDLRIYALIMNPKDPVAYISSEGVLRFACGKFDLDDLTKMYVHITNNSYQKRVGFNDRSDIRDKNLWALQEWLEFHSKTINIDQLWQNICRVMALTLSMLVKPSDAPDDNFKFWGMDLAITDTGEARLLEVNDCPSLYYVPTPDVQEKVHDLLKLLFFKHLQLPCPTGFTCTSGVKWIKLWHHAQTPVDIASQTWEGLPWRQV